MMKTSNLMFEDGKSKPEKGYEWQDKFLIDILF